MTNSILITAALCYLAGVSSGTLFGPRIIARVAGWLWPAKCEICGGKPYAVHCRATISEDGELTDESFVLLCQSCSEENVEAIARELREGEE